MDGLSSFKYRRCDSAGVAIKSGVRLIKVSVDQLKLPLGPNL